MRDCAETRPDMISQPPHHPHRLTLTHLTKGINHLGEKSQRAIVSILENNVTASDFLNI